MSDILNRINRVLDEKMGWDKKPAGWNLKSMRKFGKTLTDKDPDEHGWFAACTAKLSKHFDEPERMCASLRDSLLKTTMWRGKGKDIKKLKESHQTVDEYKVFAITDFGKSFDVLDTKSSKIKMHLPRYAVWGVVGNTLETVIDGDDDLNKLKKKYGKDIEVTALKI